MYMAQTENAKEPVTQTNDLRIVKVNAVRNAEELWASIIAASDTAWYRHSYNLAEFHRAVATNKNLIEESCFIMRGDETIGLIPILIKDGPDDTREISYNGSPSPWPCFVNMDLNTLKTYQSFALDHIISICKHHNIDRCILGLNAPSLPLETQTVLFNQALQKHRFIDGSFQSHLVNVDKESPTRMRASYRKNVRKFSKTYETHIYTGTSVSKDIEQIYFNLHVKDAGGQFRSRDSYTKMADLARKHEAAFIVCRNKESQKPVGALVIATFKDAAYDSSVSIDPDHHQDYISHILKVKALEHLCNTNIRHYELGRICDRPTLTFVPSAKEQNITFFKDGFARGGSKTSFVAEKYFNIDALERKLEAMQSNLQTYFEIESGQKIKSKKPAYSTKLITNNKA